MTETERLIQETNKMVSKIQQDLAVSITHQKQHRNELDELKIKVLRHENERNKIIGMFIIIGAFFSFLMNLIFEHFPKK